MKKKVFSNQYGFTLIEILIAITIIAVLIMVAFFSFQGQMRKGRDGRRKADLNKIKTAFEDYYNDHDCYPDLSVLDNCEGKFDQYLQPIPCDPLTKQPYRYIPAEEGLCRGYRILANLENLQDEAIWAAGCQPAACGVSTEYQDYNYGLSQGVTVYEGEGGLVAGSDDPTYTGTTPDYSDDYYCSPTLGCTHYLRHNAQEKNCRKVFDGDTGSTECQTECEASNPVFDSIRCDE